MMAFVWNLLLVVRSGDEGPEGGLVLQGAGGLGALGSLEEYRRADVAGYCLLPSTP